MRRLLVIFVDALGPAQLEAFGGRLPMVPERGAVRGVLGYSSGALATVLTGESPAQHGRMCLFAHQAPGHDHLLSPLKWLGLLPRWLHERSPVRRRVARALAAWRGLSGYVALGRVPPEAFSWLDLPERDDLFEADEIGGARTFLADARDAGLRTYVTPWQRPEDERLGQAAADIRRERPDLAFVYVTALDGVLHREGNGGRGVEAVRRTIAQRIEAVTEAMAAGGGEVVTLMVGDHGMADVDRVIDPGTRGTRRRFVDSTMMRMWGGANELEAARRELLPLGGTWLGGAELAANDVPQRTYGDAIYVLPEGSIFSPSYVGGRAAGMHGYLRQAPSAMAAVASSHALPASMRQLEDVGGWVRAQLEVA